MYNIMVLPQRHAIIQLPFCHRTICHRKLPFCHRTICDDIAPCHRHTIVQLSFSSFWYSVMAGFPPAVTYGGHCSLRDMLYVAPFYASPDLVSGAVDGIASDRGGDAPRGGLFTPVCNF